MTQIGVYIAGGLGLLIRHLFKIGDSNSILMLAITGAIVCSTRFFFMTYKEIAESKQRT